MGKYRGWGGKVGGRRDCVTVAGEGLTKRRPKGMREQDMRRHSECEAIKPGAYSFLLILEGSQHSQSTVREDGE